MWLKYSLYLRLSKPWCQDVLSDVTLDLVGCISVLSHFYYGNLTFCHRHICLLTNALQLELTYDPQLCKRIEELLRNAMSLLSLAGYMNLNYDWFILKLLFERVAIDWSVVYGTVSGNDDDDDDDNVGESSEKVSGAEESEYGEEK